MEALGAAASVAGLISLTLEVPKLINALIRVRSAPEEAKEMSKTAGALVATLQRLEAFLKTEDAREMRIADDSALTISLSVCQSKVLDLSRKLRSQSCATPNPSDNAASKALKAAATRIRWPLDRKECLEIISELRAMECTFQFCLVMQNCQQMSRSHKEVVSHLKAQSDAISQMAASFPEQAASANSMIEKLDIIGTCVSKASQEIDRIQIRLQELEEMKNDLAEFYADKLHGQALTWLSPLDPSARHQELSCARVKGTCEWIFVDDNFQRWVQNPPSEHLANVLCWVGDPGQGKTFTMSRVLDYLDAYRRSTPGTYVTYLYCDYQRTSSYSVTALLGALVRQLLCGFPKIPDQIVNLVRQAHIKQRRSSCRMEEIKQVVQLLKPYVKRLFLCIDALDEYEDSIQLVSACSGFPVPTSFLFVGRQSIAQAVKHSFPGVVERVLDYQSADINAVTSALIEKEKTYRPDLMPDSLCDDIVTEVERLANGMFLLASLHTNLVLSHNTIYRRREALRDLPRTLDSAFTQTLARVHEQVQASQALIILAWIHHVGPMSLKELRYALAIEPHHVQFHEDNLLDEKTMLDCCLGLARLDKSQRVSSHNKVALVHATLSVFFDSCPAILQKSVSIIADSCLTFLLFDQDKRPAAISSLMHRVWLQLLHTAEDPNPKNKAWRYLNLMNKRMSDQQTPVSTKGLPSHASALVYQEVPAYFADRRSRGQSLLHTACMLGLDSFDPILDRIAKDSTGLGAPLFNSTDMLGMSALGWALFEAREADESGGLHARPSQQHSYEHNIYRAERIIRKFPDLDPRHPLWDRMALERIRVSNANHRGSNRIQYFVRLPFQFFLSNYCYSPEAIGRCMSVMESQLNFNLWSALQQSSTSTPTNKGIDATAAYSLSGLQYNRWALVAFASDNGTWKAETEIDRIDPPGRHKTEAVEIESDGIGSPSGYWVEADEPIHSHDIDTRWPETKSNSPGPKKTTDSSPYFITRELVALFEPGTTMPALVAADWKQNRVSTYCEARADVVETSSLPLNGTPCRTLFLPQQALLHVGAVADSVQVVDFALSVLRVDPNLLDHKGATALQVALTLGHRSTADLLVGYDGVDLVRPDDMGQSPLHLCVQRYKLVHHVELVKTASSILSKCKSASSLQDKAGKTALHYAVESANRRLVNLLLRHNWADVNIQDHFGHTPLHVAILKRDINICEIILEQSSGSTISSDNLRIAWALTTSAGASFILPLLRFVQGLVNHRAMPGGQSQLLSAVPGHDRGLLQLVHAASQSPDFTENDLDFMLALEKTACAAVASSTTGAIALGRHGFLVDSVDAGKTIRAAILKGAGSVAAYLLGIYAVDQDQLGEDGESALHLAVVYNASQAVHFLLGRSDIDVDATDADGYTALQLAVVHKRLNILQMLLDSPRVAAGQVHNISGETALHLAVKQRFADAVPALLTAHERIPVNHLDRSGRSALHYAVMQDDTATVRLLLGCPGLAAATPSQDGRTALAYAAMSSGMEMISLLLETGKFDLRHRDSYGKTALDWARTNPYGQVAEALRSAS